MTQVIHQVIQQTTETAPGPIQERLDALQAERDASWPAERVTAHAAFRQQLEDDADRAAFIAVGGVVEPFVLDEVDGGTVDSAALLETGPLVLVLFRFESCPACNAALGGYRDTLAPALRELGTHLVGISPQVVELLRPIKGRLEGSFLIASDPEASILHRFGVAFAPSAREQDERRGTDADLGRKLGSGRWELPYPTVVVLDRGGVVRFVDIHPNWMVRTESATVVEVVRSL